MKRLYNNVKEVWQAIDQGKTVNWSSDAYTITVERAYSDNEYQKNHHTFRKGQLLRVTCTSNYFGSLLDSNEIVHLYTDKGEK